MRPCILIIDDTPGILRILKDILKDDYDILFAKTGEDGLEMAKSRIPDLIIMDVLMPPGISGIDVVKLLKAGEETMGIPIVFVTGKSDIEDESEGYALGAIDYIKKPFKREIVKHRIDFNMQYILMKRLLAQHNLTL